MGKKQSGLKIVRRKDKNGNIVTYKYIEIKRDIGDGKQRSFTGKTRREATQKYQQAKEKYIHEQHEHSYAESNMLFEDWAQKWLDVYKYGTVRHVTYSESYERPTQTHLIPHFKGQKLKDIKQSDIQAFFQAKTDYSHSMQKKLLLCLRGIFHTAIGDHLIADNPTTNIRLSVAPPNSTAIKNCLTYDQARIVIDYAKTHKNGLDVIALLKTGMRRSELIALPFCYDPTTKGVFDPNSELNGGVDMQERLIRVRQSLSKSKYGVEFGPCKNKNSMRDIPFDDELYDLLKNESNKIYYKTSNKSYTRKYLISNPHGTYIRPQGWAKRFRGFAKDFNSYAEENDLGFSMVRPHECRLSFGSILYHRTNDLVTVSKLMGHANIEITARLYVKTNLSNFRSIIEHGV